MVGSGAACSLEQPTRSARQLPCRKQVTPDPLMRPKPWMCIYDMLIKPCRMWGDQLLTLTG